MTLVTRTQTTPLSVDVTANEVYTALAHIDTAIETLRTARAWVIRQSELNESKKK